MWVDERGSEVLGVAECRQLLAIAASKRLPGHLGVFGDGAPTVLPLDYVVSGPDVVLRVGEGLFSNVAGQMVAFEVEGAGDDGRPWSVLVRGPARPEPDDEAWADAPRPRVTQPGRHLIRIQAQVVTGRRLGAQT
ncbi:MAG TPA: pyridoxamine 5'-phosphate oxidase family protein [Acidimicrobiales bacterium]|nr:pyridoxamine 5'-phosphate oxidase family protein [Acidimicrobiales bacterium]